MNKSLDHCYLTDGPRELQVPQEREALAWRATTTLCHHPASRACTPARCRAARTGTELGKSIFDLSMIFAVLARARPLRSPPTTPPLVLLMPPALNPPEPKLLPGLPTLEQLLKDLTRPTWGARAIPLRRCHQPAKPNLCNSSSKCLQAHANSGAPAQQATPQAPLPSPLYPWMRSQFGQLTHEMIS